MQARLPDRRKNHWALERVASRWKVPLAFARLELEAAGIEFVKIPQAPRLGIRLGDLLDYEERVRARTAPLQSRKPKKLEVVRL
jgi:hypothetical protein